MAADDGMSKIMRCFSCANYSIARCLLGHAAWPDARLDDCPDSAFEPGTGPIEFGGATEYLEVIKR